MDEEILLLWLFSAAAIGVAIVTAVLAVGALFGVGWLLWKAAGFFVETMDIAMGGRPAKGVRTDVISVDATEYAHLSGRVWPSGPGRVVRVQAGLVPASPCLAQRGLASVERRRRAGARGRDD